ncbi:MAG: response regulator [Phycisphaeraceae bacterium]|nr:response regulator [Phycisphaeraceae bacterium]MCP4066949.1 response regulator [Phycisphaeraceae bacterium]MCP4940265.1 response regulator [Phycisphaeraceae bacterium]MDG2133844.1 response regulator [Phycisphaerales bacterium]
MNDADSRSRARLVLPPGIAPEVFLASMPDVVADFIRTACDLVPEDPETGDPRITAALDGLGEGVAVVVEHGEIVWMNNQLADHSPELLRLFSDAAAEAIEGFMAHPDVVNGESTRLEFAHGDRHYSVLCSPMPDDSSRRTVAALISDVTDLKRTELLVEEIDHAGGDLLDLDPDTINPLDVTARLRLVEDKVIRTMRGSIGFEHFEIRLVDRRSGQLELVMGTGMEPLSIGERIFARNTENGISGMVAASGEAYVCPDVREDPLYVTGIPDARSSLTVPLKLRDRVVGVLNVESNRVDAFDERDQMIVELYGRYVAMAINILDMLVVERYTTNHNFSSTVLGEMNQPLESITRNAAELRAGYVGDGPMAEKLDAIIASVESVRSRVLACTSGPQTILGAGDDEDAIDDPVLKGRSVLVADDEATIREAITRILERRGAAVEAHEDGSGAIASMEAGKTRFDLVISDVRMPDRNGYEVFRAAKELDQPLPVILMTGFGYDPHHSIVRSSQEGLEAFLFKPFQVTQLIEEIHKSFASVSEDGD